MLPTRVSASVSVLLGMAVFVASPRHDARADGLLDAVNSKGRMPVTVADGTEYTPSVLKRYPEAAALLRRLMAEQGLPGPPSTQPGRVAPAPR